MFYRSQQLHRYAYGIVILPDGRILAVKDAKSQSNSVAGSGWHCSVMTILSNPKVNAQDELERELLLRLNMDIGKLEGHIGNAKVIHPRARGRQFVVHSFHVTKSFQIKLPYNKVAKGFTYNRILDMLGNAETRLDFSYDTEMVFRTLFETSWRPHK